MTDPETPEKKPLTEAELKQKAARAQLILYIAMFLGILLPFLVAWLTGAFSF